MGRGVVWAVWRYWRATQDDAFLIEMGGEILFETFASGPAGPSAGRTAGAISVMSKVPTNIIRTSMTMPSPM